MVTREAGTTRGTSAFAVAFAALWMGIGWSSIARAHNGEPPPAAAFPAESAGGGDQTQYQGGSAAAALVDGFTGGRPTAIAISTVPSQDDRSKQMDDPKALESVRDEVGYALSQAIDGPDKNNALLIESALALGKMHHAPRRLADSEARDRPSVLGPRPNTVCSLQWACLRRPTRKRH
jgi:hypothetical protein